MSSAKPDHRERRASARWKRLPERVCVAAVLWVMPSVLAMTPTQAQLVRETAVSVLVASGAAWIARQGKRRSDNGHDLEYK